MGKTYTMPQFVEISISADCVNATRTDITAGRHGMVIDEPPARHGNDEGMLPLQALMSALAGCSHVVAGVSAKEIGFDFQAAKIDVRASFDTRCFTGDAKVSPPFPDIKMTIAADTDATEAQLEELKQQLRWRCPVYATFLAAGTNIIGDWVLNRPDGN